MSIQQYGGTILFKCKYKDTERSANKHLPMKLIPYFEQVKHPSWGKGSWAAFVFWVSNREHEINLRRRSDGENKSGTHS